MMPSMPQGEATEACQVACDVMSHRGRRGPGAECEVKGLTGWPSGEGHGQHALLGHDVAAGEGVDAGGREVGEEAVAEVAHGPQRAACQHHGTRIADHLPPTDRDGWRECETRREVGAPQ